MASRTRRQNPKVGISVARVQGPIQVPGTALMSPPKVDFRLPEYVKAAECWQIIRDCVEGQQAIKRRGYAYLPEIMPSDKTPANRDRNASYQARAVFVGFTRRTLKGLVGQVFAKPPVLELPAAIEELRTNVDGGAVSWDQQAKQAMADAVGPGRCGLYVDYPRLPKREDGSVAVPTLAQQQAMKLRPSIQYYFAEQIINWRVEMVGGARILTMVNLEESYDVEDDGFEKKTDKQWREIRLVDGVCEIQIWRKINGVFTRFEDPVRPTGADGKNLDFIPFQFVGADNNDPGIDDPPLLDLANLNIAHYRNSADFEEMVYLLGQPTPWFSGLTEKWVKEVWKDGIALGSRAAIPLPMGAQAGLLQVSESQLALEALAQKERQAVALGAKLVEQKQVQRTATEANQEEASEASTLQTAAQNVSAAYTKCIEWLGVFVGFVPNDEQKYELNTDFEISRMTVEGRKQLLAEWTGGAISYTEYREILRRAGIATLDDEEAQAEIDAQTEKDMENNIALAGATADVVGGAAAKHAPALAKAKAIPGKTPAKPAAKAGNAKQPKRKPS